MRRRVSLSVGFAFVVVLAAPAFAVHGGIHPSFRTENVYFHCSGSTKLQNVNWQLGSGPATWDTNAPTQSFTQGAGCGSVDTFFYNPDSENLYDAVFKGTVTGNLRDLTVRLHNLVLGRVRSTTTTPLGVRLLVDGQPYLAGEAWGERVDVTPVPSSTGATELLEFSITDLGSATEIKDGQGNVVDVQTTGLATEDGDGTVPREIVLTITPFFTPYNNAFVWDATEIPSGIVINPSSPASARIRATLPDQG